MNLNKESGDAATKFKAFDFFLCPELVPVEKLALPGQAMLVRAR